VELISNSKPQEVSLWARSADGGKVTRSKLWRKGILNSQGLQLRVRSRGIFYYLHSSTLALHNYQCSCLWKKLREINLHQPQKINSIRFNVVGLVANCNLHYVFISITPITSTIIHLYRNYNGDTMIKLTH